MHCGYKQAEEGGQSKDAFGGQEDLTRIITEMLISRPRSEVFEYVTTPAKWPMWHPSSLAVFGPGADHSALVGEEVTEEFKVAGRTGSVIWKVITREEPRLWVIEGTIVGRAAGGRITYELWPHEGATRFTRIFDYLTPGLFFGVADRLVLRRRVEAESNEALQRLAALLSAA